MLILNCTLLGNYLPQRKERQNNNNNNNKKKTVT